MKHMSLQQNPLWKNEQRPSHILYPTKYTATSKSVKRTTLQTPTDWKTFVKEHVSKSPLLNSTEPTIIEELKKKYENSEISLTIHILKNILYINSEWLKAYQRKYYSNGMIWYSIQIGGNQFKHFRYNWFVIKMLWSPVGWIFLNIASFAIIWRCVIIMVSNEQFISKCTYNSSNPSE